MKQLIIFSIISIFTLSFQTIEKDNVFTETSIQTSNTNDIDGKALYTTTCKACHGKKGNSKFAGAKPLTTSELTLKETIEVITNGTKGTSMIGYKSIYSKKEIEAIAKYIQTFQED